MAENSVEWWNPLVPGYQVNRTKQLRRLIIEQFLNTRDIQDPEFGGYIYGFFESESLSILHVNWVGGGTRADRSFEIQTPTFHLKFRLTGKFDPSSPDSSLWIDHVQGDHHFKTWCGQTIERVGIYSSESAVYDNCSNS